MNESNIDGRRLVIAAMIVGSLVTGYHFSGSDHDTDPDSGSPADKIATVDSSKISADTLAKMADEGMPVRVDTHKVDIKANEPIPYPSVNRNPKPSFHDWISEYKEYAAGQGIDREIIEKSFDGVKYNQKIVRLDQNQPEFTWTFRRYRDRLLHPLRIEQGKKHIQQHLTILANIEQQTGVPGDILVAIKGIESNYGQNLGSYNPVEAAATLTYEGRREDLFKAQLISILRLRQRGQMPMNAVSSSHTAGTPFQFLPETEERFAVDGNKNDIVDMRGEAADGYASVANYLLHHGWKSGEPIMVKIDDDQAGSANKWGNFKTVADWADDLRDIPAEISQGYPDLRASLIDLSAKDEDPYLILAFENNFGALMHYNSSSKYAFAITSLASKFRPEESLFEIPLGMTEIKINAPGFAPMN